MGDQEAASPSINSDGPPGMEVEDINDDAQGRDTALYFVGASVRAAYRVRGFGLGRSLGGREIGARFLRLRSTDLKISLEPGYLRPPFSFDRQNTLSPSPS